MKVNLKKLFLIETKPSDTAMREILDEANPENLQPAFKSFFLSFSAGNFLRRMNLSTVTIFITKDGLSSNSPHINDLKNAEMSFILRAKLGGHKAIFEEFDLIGERCKKAIKQASFQNVSNNGPVSQWQKIKTSSLLLALFLSIIYT